jgi:hypothetical protein
MIFSVALVRRRGRRVQMRNLYMQNYSVDKQLTYQNRMEIQSG